MATYERWYGEHGAPDLFGQARLRAAPRSTASGCARPKLVATPGCYPTATVLALAPLAEAGLIDDVFVDAMQGTSGYGRSERRPRPLLGDDRERLPLQDRGPPPPAGDRTGAERRSAARPRSAFVPHLLPLDQGELASCFATLAEPTSVEAVRGALRGALRRASRSSTCSTGRPNLRDVRDTNECHVYVTVDEHGRVLAFAAIDNLWKGASGQAIQNLNLMLGLDETAGLT